MLDVVLLGIQFFKSKQMNYNRTKTFSSLMWKPLSNNELELDWSASLRTDAADGLLAYHFSIFILCLKNACAYLKVLRLNVCYEYPGFSLEGTSHPYI